MENKHDPWDDDCIIYDHPDVTKNEQNARPVCDNNDGQYEDCPPDGQYEDDDCDYRFDDRNYEDYPPYSQYEDDDYDDRYYDYDDQDNEYPFSDDECIVGKGGGICPCCGGIGDPNGRNAMRRMIFGNPQLMSANISRNGNQD